MGVFVAIAVALACVRSAIGFSSFAVLTYYGIANAAAWTLQAEECDGCAHLPDRAFDSDQSRNRINLGPRAGARPTL